MEISTAAMDREGTLLNVCHAFLGYRQLQDLIGDHLRRRKFLQRRKFLRNVIKVEISTAAMDREGPLLNVCLAFLGYRQPQDLICGHQFGDGDHLP